MLHKNPTCLRICTVPCMSTVEHEELPITFFHTAFTMSRYKDERQCSQSQHNHNFTNKHCGSVKLSFYDHGYVEGWVPYCVVNCGTQNSAKALPLCFPLEKITVPWRYGTQNLFLSSYPHICLLVSLGSIQPPV